MDRKSINKNLGRFAARLGLFSCSLLIKIMPWRFLYGFAGGLGRLGYRIVGRQRKVATESLAIAFGDSLSPAQREKIAVDSFVYMAKSAVELLFLMDRPQLLRQRVEISGKDNLDRALDKGNGAILVSAHFGNFPLLMSKMSLEGYKVAGIMRPMRDVNVEKFFMKKRSSLGIKTIYSQPRNTCVNSTIESLRANEVVFIPLDQNFGTAGVFVDFFARKAATATGPVVLARRTKAALVPCFIIRLPDDRHRIVFEPAIELEQGGDQHRIIVDNVQRLTCIIEGYIRKYPAEWGWVHRRWKTKAKEA